MATTDDSDRADRFLDALIVLALRGELAEDDLPDLDGPEPVLSDEAQRALDALGPDLVARIVRGDWRPRRRPRRPGRVSDGPLGRTGTMHRGQATELTDKAREEMERKVRELEAEDEGGPRP
jgi:hypothetical protein